LSLQKAIVTKKSITVFSSCSTAQKSPTLLVVFFITNGDNAVTNSNIEALFAIRPLKGDNLHKLQRDNLILLVVTILLCREKRCYPAAVTTL
jgi:hypothetical protein